MAQKWIIKDTALCKALTVTVSSTVGLVPLKPTNLLCIVKQHKGKVQLRNFTPGFSEPERGVLLLNHPLTSSWEAGDVGWLASLLIGRRDDGDTQAIMCRSSLLSSFSYSCIFIALTSEERLRAQVCCCDMLQRGR